MFPLCFSPLVLNWIHFLWTAGTSASAAHFQAYLLEGLMRWNQNRMEEVVGGAANLRIYGSVKREALDRLSRKVLKAPLDERYQPHGAYTGQKWSLLTQKCWPKLQQDKRLHSCMLKCNSLFIYLGFFNVLSSQLSYSTNTKAAHLI